MPSVKEALLQALSDLDSISVCYAVIGGLAVSARIEPRMTCETAVGAAAMITRRGYHRGRDLQARIIELRNLRTNQANPRVKL